jgi:hypothetical protein
MPMLFFPLENPSFHLAHILPLSDLSSMHALNLMPRMRQWQTEGRLIKQKNNVTFSFASV